MSTCLVIAHARESGWHIGLHDPSVEGWVILLAYAAAGLLCGIAAANVTGREALFWGATAAMMAFLCVNKQLDIQSLVTEWGRAVAEEQGWLEQRRSLQAGFVAGVAGIMLLSILGILWFMRATVWRLKLALLGLSLVAGFVLTRAASFHHLDGWLGTPIDAGNFFRYNVLFELPGIVLIGLAARLRYRAARPTSSQQPDTDTASHADR